MGKKKKGDFGKGGRGGAFKYLGKVGRAGLDVGLGLGACLCACLRKPVTLQSASLANDQSSGSKPQENWIEEQTNLEMSHNRR